MSKLTLDEAIKHCLEVAEEQSRLYSLCPCPCDGTKNCMSLKNGKDMGCTKCAAEHRQLAEWLTELKETKRLLKSAAKIAKKLPCDDDTCSECVHNDNGYVCSEYEYFEWRYADEAKKLIGGSENG